MIKAVILDVDGVLIGDKIGYNSPSPHPSVISTLKAIKEKGIYVHLCTAKPYWAIENIIKDAYLNNLHIGDGGAVLIDPLTHLVFEKNSIPRMDISGVLSACIQNKIYIEAYSIDNYFVQQNQISDITEIHTQILQRNPKAVDSIEDLVKQIEITKIMPIAQNEEHAKKITDVLIPYLKNLNISWAVHPVALPYQFAAITKKGVSKPKAVAAVLNYEKIPFTNTLGVGDSTSDWKFIELCKYKSAMGNAMPELQKLVSTNSSEDSYIGKSVDQNGILDIFKYFSV